MADNNEITRRDAVKTAGLATAAAALAVIEAPAVHTVKAAPNKVKFGMIGTGSRGAYLLKHLKGIDSGDCVALCDLKPEALQRGKDTIGGNPKLYKDYRELLADKDVEAVLIATPLYVHYPITKDAIEAGKHVFCEKCLVFTPQEVYALRDLASKHSNQILQTGLQRRYSQYYALVKKMVDNGDLGDVTHITGQWHRNGTGSLWTDKPDNWRIDKTKSGGLTAELCSHQVDVADWMFGSAPEYVVGVGGIDTFKGGHWQVYDNISLIFVYPGGRKFNYTAMSTNSHLPYFGSSRTEFGECIMGTKGAIEISVGADNLPVIALWFPEKPGKGIPGYTEKEPKKEGGYKAGATITAAAGTKGIPLLLPHDVPDEKTDSFLTKESKLARRWLYSKGVLAPEELRNPVDTELEQFFVSVRTGKKPLADLEVGLADSVGVMMANKAMDEGRRVYFNELEKMAKGVPSAPGAKKVS